MTIRKSLTVNPVTGDLQLITSGLSADKIADGSVSDAEFQRLDGITSNIQTQITARELSANKGIANGYASLDGAGKVPVAQLPAALMSYKGTWNVATNTPTLADGTGVQGNVYLVTVGGTRNLGSGSLTYQVGDWVVHNGTIWEQSPSGDDVLTVFGRIGNVVAASGDYTALQVNNVPSGNLAATNVQGALNELQSDIDTRATSSSLSTHTGSSSGVHGVSGSVVGTTDVQTLTNKTLTSPVIANFEDLTHITTPTNPSAGLLRIYAKADNKPYVLTSAGVETALIGTGDVTGPASSTSTAIARFNGTTGKVIQNSTALLDSTGVIDANKFISVNTASVNYTIGTDKTLTCPLLNVAVSVVYDGAGNIFSPPSVSGAGTIAISGILFN
jgi:hypothetical protein